jgi:REP element-mobilizing transposase RayT
MQNFQSVTTRKINRIRKTPGFKLWQRNYYEHIIRDENELNRIRKYILTNPAKWENDENNINSPQRQSNEKRVRAMHSPKK